MNQPDPSNQGDDHVEDDFDPFDDIHDPPHICEFEAALGLWTGAIHFSKLATWLTVFVATLAMIGSLFVAPTLPLREAILIWLFVVPIVSLSCHLLVLPWNVLAYRRLVRCARQLRTADSAAFDQLATPAFGAARGTVKFYMWMYRQCGMNPASV